VGAELRRGVHRKDGFGLLGEERGGQVVKRRRFLRLRLRAMQLLPLEGGSRSKHGIVRWQGPVDVADRGHGGLHEELAEGQVVDDEAERGPAPDLLRCPVPPFDIDVVRQLGVGLWNWADLGEHAGAAGHGRNNRME
jgi:hypothetical protein